MRSSHRPRPAARKANPPMQPLAGQEVTTPFEGMIARVRQGGLRVTPARCSMLTALLHCEAPVTLTRLQALIGEPPVALATLFRSMLRLEEIEMVTRSIDLRGTTNWRLNTGRTREFHLTLRNTGETISLDQELSAELARLLEQVEHRLRHRGYTQVQLTVALQGTRPGRSAPTIP
jgi:Fe2+ or Zn2+ uptake regulation protein